MYKTEQEFESDLLSILKQAKIFGKPYFKAYLGDGIFQILMLKGNPRSSHKTYLVEYSLAKDGSLIHVKDKMTSWHMSENYGYQRETKADIFQEKVNVWVSSSQAHLKSDLTYIE